VKPYSSYLERQLQGPIYPVTLANDFVFLSGLPPFESGTGEIKRLPFDRQARIVLAQSGLIACEGAQVQCLLHTRAKTLCDLQ
jgi:enamine deaminase RidA (YjgF/YER057c/UK114 family)